MAPELSIIFNSLPPMQECRSSHTSVVIGNKLYCMGGCNNKGGEMFSKYSKSVECFSFSTMKWERCVDLHCTLYGGKAVLNYTSGEVFVIGGQRNRQPSSKISLYDPKGGITNICEGNMDIERSHHVAVLL